MDTRLLSIYLNDHLAGARAGVELGHRSRRNNAGTPLGDDLGRLVREIEEDKRTLEELMQRARVRRGVGKEAGALVAERIGRLKPNGRLLSYSPLSRLEELEGIKLGVEGKRSLWRALREIQPRVSAWAGVDFDGLEERAERQVALLEAHRTEAVHRAFLPPTRAEG